MNTHFALLARFESPVVHLNDICEEFFGMKTRTAAAKVAGGEFPLPCFKLSDVKGAPYLLHISDLSKHIDNQLQSARTEHAHVNA